MNLKGKAVYEQWEKAITERDLRQIALLIATFPNLISQGIIHYRGNGTTFQTLPLNLVNDSYEASKLLIQKGADPNEYGDGNVIALHNASKEVTQLLINHGADVNKIGYEDCTPLMYEVYINNLDNVQLLIDNGAEINYQRRADGNTSLHIAAKKSDIDMIELLLKYGARKDIKNEHAHLPIDLARERNFMEALQLLKL